MIKYDRYRLTVGTQREERLYYAFGSRESGTLSKIAFFVLKNTLNNIAYTVVRGGVDTKEIYSHSCY